MHDLVKIVMDRLKLFLLRVLVYAEYNLVGCVSFVLHFHSSKKKNEFNRKSGKKKKYTVKIPT